MKTLDVTVLALVLSVGLCGCAVKTLKTSGEIDTSRRVNMVQVQFSTSLPREISIQRRAQGYMPTITNADKALAQNNSLQLMRLFADGFKKRFPTAAAAYGLGVGDASPDVPKLKVYVDGLSMGCSDFGCASVLHLRGDLLGDSGGIVWRFSSQVGQPMVRATISDEIFDSFAKELLDSMKKDKLIATK